MKIIHISDFHLQPRKCSLINLRFKCLLKKLNRDEFDPASIVIVSGDLIANAEKPGAMEYARKLMSGLQEKFDRVLVCPGNHDYGNFWGGRPGHMKPFFVCFADFLGSNSRIPGEAYHGNRNPEDSPFPVVNEFGDVVLIGLDTMEGEFEDELAGRKSDWDWGAEGRVGTRQLNALKALLERDEIGGKKVVVYLHHHPYVNKHIMNKFRDADLFNEIVRDRVDLLLFGHNHHYENMAAEAEGHGVGMALEGGSIVGWWKAKIRFRVVDTDGDSPQCKEHSVNVLKEWWHLLQCAVGSLMMGARKD